jgi:hypothetical protein
MPDMQAELQAAPLEEALLVSPASDKRRLLLSELKKDYIRNYRAIAKALGNEDPETAHYAAAAIANAKSQFENDIREFDGKYHRDRNNPALVRAYSDYVLGYLRCGILSKMEARKYSYLYLGLLDAVPKTEDDYVSLVDEAVSVGDYQTALRHAEDSKSNLNLLKVYYCTGRGKEFLKLLEESPYPELWRFFHDS